MYQASPLQQLPVVVEEHSRLEWSEEGTHTKCLIDTSWTHASTACWKRWNCMVWPLVVFCRRGAGWYSCGTSTSPFVILYIMVSLLWSLRVCRGSHPRSDTIADTQTGGLLHRKGMFFTNRAARRWVTSSLSIFLLIWVPDAGTVFKLGMDNSFVSLFLQVLRTSTQSTSEKAQHAVCGSADLINVLVPAKSAVHRDS